jgi:hypothetical protein
MRRILAGCRTTVVTSCACTGSHTCVIERGRFPRGGSMTGIAGLRRWNVGSIFTCRRCAIVTSRA